MIVTVDRLREAFHYDPDTGLFTWKISPRRAKKGDIAGCNSHGYIVIGIDQKMYPAHRLAWLYMTGEWPSAQVDHIDLNRSNNSWNNLRAASHCENQRNKSTQKNNTSGHKSVCWHNRQRKWNAQIKVMGKTVYLGRFQSFEDAAFAYSSAAKLHHGEFARVK